MRQPIQGVDPWLRSKTSTAPLWFHASSGELEYAKPVFREIKKRNPDQPILLTYFSPSIEKAATQLDTVDLAVPLPWDDRWTWTAFLDFHRPVELFVIRTDLWPEMLRVASEHQIPITLFSTSLAKTQSKFRNPVARALFVHLLQYVSRVFVVSPADAENFKKLAPQLKVTVLGDTRYDQVFFRLQNAKKIRSELAPTKAERTVILASTWPSDEKVLLPALPALIQSGLRVIWVPHEPTEDHLKPVEKRLDRMNIPHVRYTSAKAWPEGSVLVVDQVGILAELYRWSQIAFVGNSFQRHRVHSVMEPLATGNFALFGPFHHNNREALEFQKVTVATGVPCARSVQNAEEFLAAVREITRSDQFWALKAEVAAQARSKQGASSRLLDLTGLRGPG